MECNTSMGTSLNEEEDAMVKALRKATTTNLNVNFVEELVILSCNVTTDLVDLLQGPHNFKEIIHGEIWLIFTNNYLKFFFPKNLISISKTNNTRNDPRQQLVLGFWSHSSPDTKPQ